ncbi:MAG: PTPA-CTERM sorting domain-containing protein [Oscillatoriales cyanobacterium C42_A2020_001]|nr:PTPA-CTERM sorting domain-containing protein [Leptolyngbyaceae cyanobacterium C42_A2020_001]
MKNTLVKSAVLFGTVTAGFVSVAPAHAAFLKGTCSLTDVTAGGFNATDCRNFDGNDTGFQNNINAAFGTSLGSWKLVGKSDVNTDNVADLASGVLQSGNWGFTQSFFNIKSPFVITLKASNFFAAYLFNGLPGSFTGGTFNVAGITTDDRDPTKHAALSHLSIYNQVGARIPTPALLPGLIAVGANMLRKRKAEQGAEADAKA